MYGYHPATAYTNMPILYGANMTVYPTVMICGLQQVIYVPGSEFGPQAISASLCPCAKTPAIPHVHTPECVASADKCRLHSKFFELLIACDLKVLGRVFSHCYQTVSQRSFCGFLIWKTYGCHYPVPV